MSSHLSPAAQVRHRIPRIAEAAVERARLTVVPRRRTRAARVPFVALVSLLLVGGVVGLLLFNTSMQQAAFATTALEQQAETLTAREQTLKSELEGLRDPRRVAEQAQKGGLVPAPVSTCFLRLDTGKIEGTCTPAVATDRLTTGPKPPVKPSILSPAPVIVQASGTGGGQGSRPGDTGRGDRDSGRASGRTEHQQSPNQQSGDR
jgi:cell division protein FtsB